MAGNGRLTAYRSPPRAKGPRPLSPRSCGDPHSGFAVGKHRDRSLLSLCRGAARRQVGIGWERVGSKATRPGLSVVGRVWVQPDTRGLPRHSLLKNTSLAGPAPSSAGETPWSRFSGIGPKSVPSTWRFPHLLQSRFRFPPLLILCASRVVQPNIRQIQLWVGFSPLKPTPHPGSLLDQSGTILTAAQKYRRPGTHRERRQPRVAFVNVLVFLKPTPYSEHTAPICPVAIWRSGFDEIRHGNSSQPHVSGAGMQALPWPNRFAPIVCSCPSVKEFFSPL